MRARAAWFLFFLLVAFAFAGTRPLGEPDEGRYGEAAREMLIGGDWLVPHLQGQPHLTKPALPYWVMAGGMRLLGVNEWGLRLGVALAFFLTILCVVELARTWGMSAGASRAAGLIFATSLLPFVSGHLLTTDMILTFWETLGILALWKTWRASDYASLWRWVFWVAFGAAFLTKGPPGWLPLLAALIFFFSSRMFRPRRPVFSVPAFLAFLIIALAWYVAIIMRDPSKLRYFIVDEVIDRVATNLHRREEPWWFYPITILFGLTPWLFLWPRLIRTTLLEIKPELADRGAFPSFTRLRASVHQAWESSYSRGEAHFLAFLWHMLTHSLAFAGFKIYHFWHRLRRTEDIKFFSFLWFFVPLAVFSCSTSKMFLYLVPLFVPLSIWCGHLLSRWKPRLLPPEPAAVKWVFPLALLWIAAALLFVTASDRQKAIHAHRRLGFRVGEYARQVGARMIYDLDDPQNSLSFYSGLRLQSIDQNLNGVLRYLRNLPAPDGPLLLAVSSSKLRKLSDTGYTKIAEDGNLTVIQVAPAPQPSK